MEHSYSNNKFLFDKKGFLISKGIVDEYSIKEVFLSLNMILKKYYKDAKTYKGWNDIEFHELMLKIKKNDPKIFSKIYDTMQVSIPLFSLTTQKNISNMAAHLLSVKSHDLAATGFMLRMDVPFDSKNKLNWHQDNAYYKQNLDGNNGLVVWIPMHDVDIENGTVMAIEGSHELGLITPKRKEKINYVTSEQFVVPDDYINHSKQINVVAKQKDIAFFNMNLIHRSGDNTSDKIRFVAGVRYHKMISDDFVPGRLNYVYSNV